MTHYIMPHRAISSNSLVLVEHLGYHRVLGWVPTRQPRYLHGYGSSLGELSFEKQGLTAKEHHQDGGELLKARVGSHVAKTNACQRCENEIHTRDVSRLQEAGENKIC